MRRFPLLPVYRILIAFLVLVSSRTGSARADSGAFLVISDIHFDPFFDGTLFDRLASRPVEQWRAILDESKPGGFSPRGTDSNYALLRSSLEDARRRNPGPDFILYPGDFPAHQWSSKYDRLAKRSHLDDPQAYRDFTTKVIRFLAGEFARAFPGVAILPTLGNDDSYCGDYMIEPEGPFLAMFAEAWAPLLGPAEAHDSFLTTFPIGGYYSMRLPHLKNGRLIVINSVFFSVNYKNTCGGAGQTPALDQFRWLDQVLDQARADGESVWLLMHVPPGIDSFNSAESVTGGGPAETFWQRELTGRFLRLARERRGTIKAAFAGHTHMDDYRVVRVDGRPDFLIKIAPAVSPIFGNNPGYQVFQYDRDAATIEDFQTYYLTDLDSQPRAAPHSEGRWALEYDFREAYSAPAPSAQAVAGLADGMSQNALVRRNYTTFYGVSAALEITPKTLDVYRCAMDHVAEPDFLRCLSGSPKPRRPSIFPDRRPAAIP